MLGGEMSKFDAAIVAFVLGFALCMVFMLIVRGL